MEKGPCGEAINCSGSQRRVPGPFKRLQDIEAGPRSVRLGGLRQPPVSTHTPITMEGFAPWQRPSPLSKAPSPEPAGPRPPQATGCCEETRWAASGSGSMGCCGAVPSMGQDAGSRWLWGCGTGGMSPRSLVPGSRPALRQGCCRAQQQGPSSRGLMHRQRDGATAQLPEVQQGPEPRPDTGQEHGTAPHRGHRRAGGHCSSQTLSVPSLRTTKTCVWTSPWQKKERFCQQCSPTSPTGAPVNHQ